MTEYSDIQYFFEKLEKYKDRFENVVERLWREDFIEDDVAEFIMEQVPFKFEKFNDMRKSVDYLEKIVTYFELVLDNPEINKLISNYNEIRNVINNVDDYLADIDINKIKY